MGESRAISTTVQWISVGLKTKTILVVSGGKRYASGESSFWDCRWSWSWSQDRSVKARQAESTLTRTMEARPWPKCRDVGFGFVLSWMRKSTVCSWSQLMFSPLLEGERRSSSMAIRLWSRSGRRARIIRRSIGEPRPKSM